MYSAVTSGLVGRNAVRSVHSLRHIYTLTESILINFWEKSSIRSLFFNRRQTTLTLLPTSLPPAGDVGLGGG